MYRPLPGPGVVDDMQTFLECAGLLHRTQEGPARGREIDMHQRCASVERRLPPAISATLRAHRRIAARLLLLPELLWVLLAVCRRSVGIHTERQNAADLSCSTANGATKLLIAESTADGAAQRLAELTDQAAEEALRSELCLLSLLSKLPLLPRHGIKAEWQQASQLTCGTANGAAELLVAECTADCAAQWLAKLTKQVAKEALR